MTLCICVCGGKPNLPMINCDNEKCSIKIFHYKCMSIKRCPAKNKSWCCIFCRKDTCFEMK